MTDEEFDHWVRQFMKKHGSDDDGTAGDRVPNRPKPPVDSGTMELVYTAIE